MRAASREYLAVHKQQIFCILQKRPISGANFSLKQNLRASPGWEAVRSEFAIHGQPPRPPWGG